jgi:hypothetical protein
MRSKLLFAALAIAACAGFADDISKWDPRMAVDNAVVSNDVKWIDGKFLPIEGRMYDDVTDHYDRLPQLTANVNGGVHAMRHHTSGMMFRFKTNSRKLVFKWIPYNENLAMDHMPATGVSGIDVYGFDKKKGKWLYKATGRIRDAKAGGNLQVWWQAGDECLVNLPLYNGLKAFSLGIDTNATIEALGPRKSGVDRPVVFYGTSITHGGCASRPGLAFVNRIGRDLDVPVVGLGFSGSGLMEYELSDVIGRIDASCYVLDCLWNMNDIQWKNNYEPFIRNLRKKRPTTPIIMAGRCDFKGLGWGYERTEVSTKKLYEKLIAEGWKDLHFLPKDDMLGDDFEGTVDGVHPNDLGMERLAKTYGKAVKEALKLK